MTHTDAITQLGNYHLTSILDSGGMGQVWRGKHQYEQYDVAIKVIHANRYKDVQSRRAFTREVEAVASLSHSNICQVLDYGRVGAQAAYDSKGALTEGAAWLAMDLYTGGTLLGAMPMVSWSKVKQCLTQVLKGLAHAHAHGVIHRDIKPENILVQYEDGKTRYALSDFGLAHPTSRIMSSQTVEFFQMVTGTPLYMPPEQLEGAWRDFGPWTDLYALGCLAYELCCHQTPYYGETVLEVARHHLNSEIPVFTPQIDAPRGLDRWIESLLQKDPYARPQRAMDALIALELLEEEPMLDLTEWSERSMTPNLDEDTLVLEDRELYMNLEGDYRASGTIPNIQHFDRASILSQTSSPPLQVTRSNTQDQETFIPGLGLLGLREFPLVERKEEFSLLWDHFEKTCNGGPLCIATIHGARGVGKTKLASWFMQRADELGLANTITLYCNSDETIGMSSKRMYQTLLRCQGLRFRDTKKRILDFLTRHSHTEDKSPCERLNSQAETIAHILYDPIEGDKTFESKGALLSPQERMVAMYPLVLALSSKRALILCLEDVHRHGHTLNVLKDFIQENASEASNIFILMTCHDQAVELSKPLAVTIDEISNVLVKLKPFGRIQQRQFIGKILTFEQHTLDVILNRSKGLPLFALQIIQQWATQERLESTPEGFRLMLTGDSEPEDMTQLWAVRVKAIAEHGFPLAKEILELGAVRGQHVAIEDWKALCLQHYDVDIEVLLEELIRSGLITQDDDVVLFKYKDFQDYLIDSARSNERWKTHHTWWVELMLSSPKEDRIPWLRRLLRHLVHVESWLEAATWSSKLAEVHRAEGEYGHALTSMHTQQQCYVAEGLPQNDERAVRNEMEIATLLYFTGQQNHPKVILEGLQTLVEPNTLLYADVLRKQALIDLASPSPQSFEKISQAQQIYEHEQDNLGLSQILHIKGWHTLLRDGSCAREHFVQSIYHARLVGSQNDYAWGLQGIAECDIRDLELDSTQKHAQQAYTSFKQLGNRIGAALSMNVEAQMLLLQGHAAQALECSEEIIDTIKTLQAYMTQFIYITAATCCAVVRAPEETQHYTEELARRYNVSSNHNTRLVLTLIMAVTSSRMDQLNQARSYLEQACSLLNVKHVASVELFVLAHYLDLNADDSLRESLTRFRTMLFQSIVPETRRAFEHREHLVRYT